MRFLMAELYSISKLLGHANVTQIYAKIVDENKRRAVNLIPKNLTASQKFTIFAL